MFSYGVGSKENITIDEIINSSQKLIRADQKELKAIIKSIDEIKTDSKETEIRDREEIRELLDIAFEMFKKAYD